MQGNDREPLLGGSFLNEDGSQSSIPDLQDSNARAAQAFSRKKEYYSKQRPSLLPNSNSNGYGIDATSISPRASFMRPPYMMAESPTRSSPQLTQPNIDTSYTGGNILTDGLTRKVSISSPDLASQQIKEAFEPAMSIESLGRPPRPPPTGGLFVSSALTQDPPVDENLQCLDLENVIAHFETIEKQATMTMGKPKLQLSQTPRFTFYSEKTGVMRSTQFSNFNISMEGSTVRDTLTTGPFWIDVCSPTSNEMNEISKVFGIHPLTNEDIQTPDTREKCEVFSRYYFVVIRSFEQDQYKHSFLQPITVYIVIFDECILTFSSSPNPHSRNVRSRIDQLSSYGDVSITTEWINYALIDDITDSFIPLLRIVEIEVDAIEEQVLIPSMKDDYVDMDMLRKIGMVRKRVMQLLRLMSTKADVIKTIINRYMNQQGETRFYLEDIHDHIATMMQNLIHYEQSLGRSHSNYLAQISIDITRASNRTSDTVMRMTLLGSILVPLNLITGLFGMNVKVPGQDEDTMTWFYGICGFMLILTISTYYWIKKASKV